METEAETRARNKEFATAEATKLLAKMAACDHDLHQFSEFSLSGIYCPKCHTLLDASLGDPWEGRCEEPDMPISTKSLREMMKETVYTWYGHDYQSGQRDKIVDAIMRTIAEYDRMTEITDAEVEKACAACWDAAPGQSPGRWLEVREAYPETVAVNIRKQMRAALAASHEHLRAEIEALKEDLANALAGRDAEARARCAAEEQAAMQAEVTREVQKQAEQRNAELLAALEDLDHATNDDPRGELDGPDFDLAKQRARRAIAKERGEQP